MAMLPCPGDRIVGVGDFEVGRATWVIDCSGLVIAPGFIDLHNHSDKQVIDRQRRAVVNYLMQGCTTIVTGNCGSGPVDVDEYFRRIRGAGVGTNVIHLIPHGSLHRNVVGTSRREPTESELARMQQLADKAMRDGAWGMSTGLIYVPGSYSTTEELIALAKTVARHRGVYASHIRNEGTNLLASVKEALRIGREADLPVHVSHFKSSGRDAWGLVREAAKMIDTARQAGQRVTADQYPYVASSTSLDATVIPSWARAGGRRELIKRLDDSDTGKRIRSAVRDNLRKRDDGAAIRIARFSKRTEWVGRSLREIAEAERVTPAELALGISRMGGASIVNFSMDEADVRAIMKLPWVATASDGRSYVPSSDKPHPRSYGTFARKIGHYSRDEKVISAAQAVRSASGLPADILDLKDRGYLRVNCHADIAVYDPKRFRDTATFEDPHQYAAGMRYVFVNGVVAVSDGIPTGARAGRPLKHSDRIAE